MTKNTDIRVVTATLFFLPVKTRVPLKFGPETLTSVTCARVRVVVVDRRGRTAEGWGETPLSVQWVWPGSLPYEPRHQALQEFCRRLATAWVAFEGAGHPLELGEDFQRYRLTELWREFNRRPDALPESIPWLAALVCCSPFDLAIHDAYGKLLGRPTYTTYGPEFLNRDLGEFLEPATGAAVSFRGRFPAEFLAADPRRQLSAWHLVGGLDLLDQSERQGDEPDDGYPVTLPEWIQRDGLRCLKVKLRGTDAAWDYARLTRVGEIAAGHGVAWLSADFNCTVTDPEYVNAILDRLRDEHPRLYGMLLYVEQPFPYELEAHPLDVRSVAARKPLFLDESAHDWRLIRLGRQLGWTGVALKTCKTQTGAILSACWARAHGLGLMVQDLTNPMLAQIPHVLLAAHVGTIMGVETNAMQFYPEASAPERRVHPGLYLRRNGTVDLGSVRGLGFGYRLEEIQRELPSPVMEASR
ncbi:MAG: mandelate racemase/muconate lactonizing enzyme family protein [Verrucomicrobia bacterium]|nr:mandelate racemase/muconate lactonizing enzyme family protein [Verrucomicrobiota bacterium]